MYKVVTGGTENLKVRGMRRARDLLPWTVNVREPAKVHVVLQHKVRCPAFQLADSENRVAYSVPRTRRVCELIKGSFYYVSKY